MFNRPPAHEIPDSPEGTARSISGISKNAAEPRSGGNVAIDLLNRDLGLRQSLLSI